VNYCYIDIYEDGVLVAHDGYSEVPPVEGDVDIYAEFKEGTKRIQIYFPTFYESAIDSLELSDGATFAPVAGRKTFVFYGDSITQGYSNPYPGNTYPNIVCRHFDAICLNQASGGAQFISDLIIDTSVKADVVFIAYGVNDWFYSKSIELDAVSAIERARKQHPTAKIIAITPVFCGYAQNNGVYSKAFLGLPCTREADKNMDFGQMQNLLKEIYSRYPDITVIDGATLIPPETQYFQHDLLHPNEAGFIQYGKNLVKQLETILQV
jgi:lysophospholipase L1-like esterase